MKNAKKVQIFRLFLGLIIFLSTPVMQCRSLDLILLLDAAGDRAKGGPISDRLAIALHQKTAPIVVSESVLYQFLRLRREFNQKAQQRDSLEWRITRFGEDLKKIADQKEELERHFKEKAKTLEKFLQEGPVAFSLRKFFKATSFREQKTEILSYQRFLESLKEESIGTEKQDIEERIEIANQALRELEEIKSLQNKIAEIMVSLPTAIRRTHLMLLERSRLLQSQSEVKNQKLLSYKMTLFEKHGELYYIMQQNRLAELRVKKKPLDAAEKKLIDSLVPLSSNINLQSYLYSKVTFDRNEWTVYKHGRFYLFIPKNYEERNAEEWQKEKPEKRSATYTDRELALGLVVDHPLILEPITIIDLSDLYAQIGRNVDQYAGINALLVLEKKILIRNLQEIFVYGKEEEKGSWNIYLIGHGYYTLSKEQQARDFEKMAEEFKESLGELNKMIPKIERVLGTREAVSAGELEAFGVKINKLFIAYLNKRNENIFDPEDEDAFEFIEQLIKRNLGDLFNELGYREAEILSTTFAQYLKFLAGKTADHFNEAKRLAAEKKFPESPSGAIAGMPLDVFTSFLLFLQRDLKTGFLYYITCFGGGFSLEQIRRYAIDLEKNEKNVLSTLSPNFIIAVGALTDASVASFSLYRRLSLDEMYKLRFLVPLNFSTFFNALRQFFAKDKPFKEDPLKEILKQVTSRQRYKEAAQYLHGISDVPSIYIPGTRLFRAVEVDKQIKVVTYALTTARELENKPIEARDKSAVLLYPRSVRVPINIGVDSEGAATALVSMIPGDATHVLSEVDASGLTLWQFLRESIADMRIMAQKTFFIKILKCKNYRGSGLPGAIDEPLTLREVFIQNMLVLPSKRRKGMMPYEESIRWSIIFRLERNGKSFYYFSNNMLDLFIKDPAGAPIRRFVAPLWEEVEKNKAIKIMSEMSKKARLRETMRREDEVRSKPPVQRLGALGEILRKKD